VSADRACEARSRAAAICHLNDKTGFLASVSRCFREPFHGEAISSVSLPGMIWLWTRQLCKTQQTIFVKFSRVSGNHL